MSIAQAISQATSTTTSRATSSALSKASTSSSTSSTSSATGYSVDNFLELLISEVTNQNPMEPMDNATMVSQLSQFETVNKLEDLNDKISSMMVYQNLMSSVDLIGKEVSVLNSNTGATITGKVEGVRIENGFPGVVVGGNFYDVSSIQTVN